MTVRSPAADLSGVTQGAEAVFTEDEFDRRIAAARDVAAARGIDVLVLTGPENIFYLTGHQTPGYYTFQCLLLPVEGEPLFLIRQLEALNCRANSFIERIETYQDDQQPSEALVTMLRRLGWVEKGVAIEKKGWFLPIAFYEQLRAAMGEVGEASGVVEGLRMVKSGREIDMIEHAAACTDAGLEAGLAATAEGASENDLVAAMMAASIRAGSEYMGMDPLVSSGPRGGIPHATWRRRRIDGGDGVFLEMAGCYNRYHAGLMRTAWIGRTPDEARRMMDACLEGLEAALSALKPGATCEDVHGACQAVIDRYGYTDNYRKRTGYSTGISFAPDWGEGNIVSLFTGVDTEVKPGMAFHIPPALRIYGRFTVGVSETAVVTETGCRTLSRVARDLVEV
jgi:Xaa-Pro dipeptidase